MKSFIKYFSASALVLFLLVGVTSCKTTKPIVKQNAGTIEDKNSSVLFADILSRQPDFNTLSSKMDVTLQTGSKSVNSKASFKMRKNQAIQISLQPLFGVEVARLLVKPDTIIIIDRLNKRYVMESIQNLKKKYPVGFDFYTLQALFANQIFVSGSSENTQSDVSKFRITQDSNAYVLSAKDASSQINYMFKVNAKDRVIETNLSQDGSARNILWQYLNFVTINNLVYPISMKVIAKSTSRTMNVDMNFNSVNINNEVEFSGTIPGSYARVSLDEIIKFMGSL